jgi:hypothetical protein
LEELGLELGLSMLSLVLTQDLALIEDYQLPAMFLHEVILAHPSYDLLCLYQAANCPFFYPQLQDLKSLGSWRNRPSISCLLFFGNRLNIWLNQALNAFAT